MTAATAPLDRTVVPLQPQLSRQAQYSERLLEWNPCAKKNLALCYQFRTGAGPAPIRILPDACPDFLFLCDPSRPSAFVSGLITAPRELELRPDSLYFGFKPYSVKGMRPLRIPWCELVDHRVTLEEQLSVEGVLEAMASAETFDARIKAIHAFALAHLSDQAYSPDFVEFSELQLCNARGNIRTEAVSERSGYTDRYCRTKFKEALGVSLKQYASIMRFQNAVRMMPSHCLADVVYDNGYFDQPHFNHEFRRFAGDTPIHFRKTMLSC